MARAGFYNENEGRSFPFLKDDEYFPNDAVVACGFMVGPNSNYADGTNVVKLVGIHLVGTTIVFVFESDATSLVGKQIKFTREVTAPKYEIEFADYENDPSFLYEQAISVGGSISDSYTVDIPASLSFSSDEYGCDNADAFSGYLVTGDLANLVATLESSGNQLTGSAVVEPALIQNLRNSYVRSINVANADRTRYTSPDGCQEQSWAVEPQPLYVGQTCVQGRIAFQEGYNVSIRQSERNNTLRFDASVGGGDGQPCAQVPVYDGEEAPAGSSFLEGGPGCGEVFHSINGAGGRHLNIIGGQGVSVSFVPGRHRVIIDVDTNNMAVCAPENVLSHSDSLSCLSDPTFESCGEV